MKNACCKLSAVSLSLIPHCSPLSTSQQALLLSSSVIAHTHTSPQLGLVYRQRCLVNLSKLYDTDTQLVVGALTRPEKKRLGLLQTGAVNRNRIGFTGLQGLSYSQTIQLICQGDPKCSPPSLWFVHTSVCLQSRRVNNMRLSMIRSPSWQQAITHLVHLSFIFRGPEQDDLTGNFTMKSRVWQAQITNNPASIDHSIFDVMPRRQLCRGTNTRSDYGSYSTHVVCSPQDSDLHNRFHKHLFKCSDLCPLLHQSTEGILPFDSL